MPDNLEDRLRSGDLSVFAEAFQMHRPRLWQLVHFRMDDRIRARVDPDDVVQDVYLAAESRLRYFVEGDFPSLFLWLRLVAQQTLSSVHRTHLATESRSVSREKSAAYDGEQTARSLTSQFVACLTSPSQVAVREELMKEVREAIETISDLDREIIALRHFEELSNQEVAAVLEIQSKTASIRYVRALSRLKRVLDRVSAMREPGTDPSAATS